MSESDSKKILVVDDEPGMRLMLTTFLNQEGYEVVTAAEIRTAEALAGENRFSAVITDLSMPGGSGLDLLSRLKALDPELPVVVMSAYGSSESAITAMRLGAFDYVFKPFQPDEILFSLKKAEANLFLTRENARLKEAVGHLPPDGLIYKSRVMAELMTMAGKAAQSDLTVLISGESGTGKELVARAIHQASPRKKGPFVAVNCGAIAESLLESELFGHVRGAFTGAEREREGFFRAANGGTLFLDEIGELPVSFQVKLLRAIQFSEVTPVGSETPVKLDVRLLAATSRDLESMVRQFKFREDLFYRLNVLPLNLPPLRKRPEDIPLLADHFVGRLSTRLGRPRPVLTDEFLQDLSAHDWPGNIRELENLMDRLLVMAPDQGRLDKKDLPLNFNTIRTETAIDPENLDLKRAIKRLEADYIRSALSLTGGNRSEAARRLGLSYPSLLSKIKLYELD